MRSNGHAQPIDTDDPFAPEPQRTPTNIVAEQNTLGSMILDAPMAHQVLDYLTADDFYSDVHQLVFLALAHLEETGRGIDATAVREAMDQRGQSAKIKDGTYLFELMDSVPTHANGMYYAAMVREKAEARRFDALRRNLAAIDVNRNGWRETSLAIVDQAAVACIVAAKAAEEDPDDMTTRTNLQFEILGRTEDARITGLSTGFPALDAMTSGLEPGELIIVAARPGQGKTALALSIARHVASRPATGFYPGGAVLWFGLEMSQKALWRRVLAMEADISIKRLKENKLSDPEMERYEDANRRINDWQLRIKVPAELTVAQLRRKVAKDVKERNTALVVIDYAQLMTASGRDAKEQTTQIATGISAVAREFNLPVMLLSQLSRTAEDAAGKVPTLRHLLNSGSLEAAASVVIFPHRPDYYTEPGAEKPPDDEPQPLELHVAKERDGQVGVAHAAFIPNRTFCYEPKGQGFS